MIDVASSFGGRRRACTALLRALLLLLSLQVLLYDVYTYPPHNLYLYLGYLTHWGHVLSLLYFFSAFSCTLLPKTLQQPLAPHDAPHWLVRTTWGLYSTVAPLELAITLLYWASGLQFGPVTYVAVMEHGGLALLLLMDGLVWSLIPIRVKHVVFLLTVCLLYFAWTIVDALANIGGGEWGPAYNDDALYPVLNWKERTRSAAILSAFAVLVLAPALFATCWMLSLMSPKPGCCCKCTWDGSRRPLYREGDSNKDVFDYQGLDHGKAVMCHSRYP